KEVKQDEKDDEQESSRQRGCLLECHETNGKAESWYGMPQMKGLKELKLLVSNETFAGRYGEIREIAEIKQHPPYLP
ncbi:MAG TPA: hypothetical protein VFG02_01655, partial [Nitrospirota bacterium]|nr:hypothetical protein [Nitrospirota bacterium]